MKLNLSSPNNMSSTTNDAVHQKPSDTIEKQYPNHSKNYQNSISNVAVHDDAQSFGKKMKK